MILEKNIFLFGLFTYFCSNVPETFLEEVDPLKLPNFLYVYMTCWRINGISL